MSANVAKLKKRAAEFEQKKQFDKALATYIQILEESDGTDDADVALYNRVGDLLLRQGSVGDAVTYYEKAVDLYAEGGFFNNAIALCNKILRQSPGRNSIYYKLGKISAKKGFRSDAKQNFLEYADRMQKAGQIDEAFRALKEFADLCPDQEDVRLMLAEQLAKKGRKGEAMEQLQALYDRFETEGRSTEARATVDRMKAIDPEAEPKAGSAPTQDKSSELVFLDVTWDDQQPKRPMRATVPVRPPAEARTEPPRAPAAPAARATVPIAPPKPAEEDTALPMLESGAPDDPRLAGSGTIEGLTRGGFEGGAGAGMLDIEPTNLGELEAPLVDPGEAMLNLEPPLSGSEFASLRLETPADLPAVAPKVHDLSLPGELPMLDVPGMGESGAAGGGGDLELIMPDEPGASDRDAGPALLDLEPPISRHSGAPTSDFVELDIEHSIGGFDSADGDATDLPMLDVGDSFGMIDDARELSSLDAVQPAALDYLGDAVPPGQRPSALPTVGDVSRLVPPDELRPRDYGAEGAAALPADAAIAPATLDGLARTGAPAPELLADAPAAPARRASTSMLAQSVDALRLRAAASPDDAGLRRQLGEALLEAGDREGGLAELDAAMIGFERREDLETARSIANEIIRVSPTSVRHLQKCVEYAFRTNDKPRLVDAYLQLADGLFRGGQQDKSRAVYQRVIELAPDDVRAQAALSAFVDAAPAPAAGGRRESAPQPRATGARRYTAEVSRANVPEEPAAAAGALNDDEFVNLGDWLRDEQGPKSTRMVVDEREPTGDEQADFADMLRKFKQGVSENVDEEDHESHYDLGVAYKEMGLLDEAIAEFQKALRGPGQRVRTYEALGQCFIEKEQFQIASTILQRALAEGHGDDQLVGVLYLLGYASEALQRWSDAIAYYQRVFAVDIQFRDVAERLTMLERVAK